MRQTQWRLFAVLLPAFLVDRSGAALSGASPRRLQSTTIRIAFSVSETGKDPVPPGFKEQLDISLANWEQRVKESLTLYPIGASGATFQFSVKDDKSDLETCMDLYLYWSGLSWQAKMAQLLFADTGIVSKVDVLFGPSQARYTKAAVMVAKEAELPIVLWATSAEVYWEHPGWNVKSMIGWDDANEMAAMRMNFTNTSVEGPNGSVRIWEEVPDNSTSVVQQCEEDLIELDNLAMKYKASDAWQSPVFTQAADDMVLHAAEHDPNDEALKREVRKMVTEQFERAIDDLTKGPHAEDIKIIKKEQDIISKAAEDLRSRLEATFACVAGGDSLHQDEPHDLPQWLKQNMSLPYELLDRKFRDLFEDDSSVQPDEYDKIIEEFLTPALRENINVVHQELINSSKQVIRYFRESMDADTGNDLDAAHWDVGYKYVYDVTVPNSLIFTDTLMRLQPPEGGGRAWFFSFEAEDAADLEYKTTCGTGAKLADDMGYEEVIVTTLRIDQARRMIVYFNAVDLPEVMVLCGGHAFIGDVVMMLKAFSIEPKSLVVWTHHFDQLMESMSGYNAHYLLKPMPYPIPNMADLSYLYSNSFYRYDAFKLAFMTTITSTAITDPQNGTTQETANTTTTTVTICCPKDGNSLVDKQITAAASLVTYAAVLASAQRDHNFVLPWSQTSAKDFHYAVCPSATPKMFSGALGPYPSGGGPMELPTDMGELKYNCSHPTKLGKRVRPATREGRLTSTRQLRPFHRGDGVGALQRYLDMEAKVVAKPDEVEGQIINQNTGFYVNVGPTSQLYKVGHASLTAPMETWAVKEASVYPCKPGCYFDAAEIQCLPCPAGTYRTEAPTCKPCVAKQDESGLDSYQTYADNPGSPKCQRVPKGAVFTEATRAPVAASGWYYLNAFSCKADHGTDFGGPVCCGQPGVITDMRFVCPGWTLSACVGYRAATATTPEQLGSCKRHKEELLQCEIGVLSDYDEQPQDNPTQYSDCSSVDGSGKSEGYPCKCGRAVCGSGYVCYAGYDTCMLPPVEPVVSECFAGLCTGNNQCVEGNAGALCLTCENGYENYSLKAIQAHLRCQKCSSKTVVLGWSLIVVVFWVFWVWTLSSMFAADAQLVVSVRGSVVRILLSYFQLLGIASEMASVDIMDQTFQSYLLGIQFLFIRPMDLVTDTCLLDQAPKGAPAEQYLESIENSMMSAFAAFVAGSCAIVFVNFAIHWKEVNRPIVKIWGLVGACRFWFNCFPTTPTTRHSRREHHKLRRSMSQEKRIAYNTAAEGGKKKQTQASPFDPEDDKHCFEVGGAHRYAKKLMINNMWMVISDITRQLLVWVIIMYPVVLRALMFTLRCETDVFKLPRLNRNFDVVCYTEAHWAVLPGSILVFVLWGLGVPCLFLYIGLWSIGPQSIGVKRRRTLSPLLQGFRPTMTWWQAWIQFRLFLLMLCQFWHYNLMRVWSAFCVATASLIIHVSWSPYVTCARHGLWYFEIFILTCVDFVFIVYAWTMFIDYKQDTATFLSKILLDNSTLLLVALEAFFTLRALSYGVWLLAVTTLEPHMEDEWMSGSAHFLYKWYRKFVRKFQGTNPVIIGFHQGEKYIDVQHLTFAEKMYLIWNLRETLAAAFDTHAYFAPGLLSVIFHEAFRRAAAGRAARQEDTRNRRVSNTLRDRVRQYMIGDTHHRDKVTNLTNTIESVRLHIATMEESKKTAKKHEIPPIQADLERSYKKKEMAESKLQELKDSQKVRHDFTLTHADYAVQDYDRQLSELRQALVKQGYSRKMVEGHLFMTDSHGDDVQRHELKTIDKSRFPIVARLDVSKRVTVEELASALADVNIDVLNDHPQFQRYQRGPDADEGDDEDEGAASPKDVGKDAGEGQPASSTTGGRGAMEEESTRRERADAWTRKQEEWMMKRHSQQILKEAETKKQDIGKQRGKSPNSGPTTLQSMYENEIITQSMVDELEWMKEAHYQQSILTSDLELRKETFTLGEKKQQVRQQRKYNASLVHKLRSLGVDPDTGEVSAPFDPLDKGEILTHGNGLKRALLTDGLAPRPTRMQEAFDLTHLRSIDELQDGTPPIDFGAAVHPSATLSTDQKQKGPVLLPMPASARGQANTSPALKLKIHVKQALNLKSLNYTGDAPWCHGQILCEKGSHGRKKIPQFKTGVRKRQLDPAWDEYHILYPWYVGESIKFTIFDQGVVASKNQGSVVVPCTTFYPYKFSGLLKIEGIADQQAKLHVDIEAIVPPTHRYAMFEAQSPLSAASPELEPSVTGSAPVLGSVYGSEQPRGSTASGVPSRPPPSNASARPRNAVSNGLAQDPLSSLAPLPLPARRLPRQDKSGPPSAASANQAPDTSRGPRALVADDGEPSGTVPGGPTAALRSRRGASEGAGRGASDGVGVDGSSVGTLPSGVSTSLRARGKQKVRPTNRAPTADAGGAAVTGVGAAAPAANSGGPGAATIPPPDSRRAGADDPFFLRGADAAAVGVASGNGAGASKGRRGHVGDGEGSEWSVPLSSHASASRDPSENGDAHADAGEKDTAGDADKVQGQGFFSGWFS